MQFEQDFYPRSSGIVDKNGIEIQVGDKVRMHQGKERCEGVVVFANGAFRIEMTKDFSGRKVDGSRFLQYNSSLIFDEVTGTAKVEVISVQESGYRE